MTGLSAVNLRSFAYSAQTQAAGGALPSKNTSPARNIKDEYVPSSSTASVSLGDTFKKMFAKPTFGAKPLPEISLKTESRPHGRLYSEEADDAINQVIDSVIESLDLHEKVGGKSFMSFMVDKDGRFVVGGHMDANLSASELKAFENALNKATLNGKPLGEHLKHVWNDSVGDFLEQQKEMVKKLLGDTHRLLQETGDVEQEDGDDQPNVTSENGSDTPEKIEDTQLHQPE